MIYPCYLAIDITLQDLVLEELFIVLLIVSRMPTEQALTGGLPRSVSVPTAGTERKELGLEPLQEKEWEWELSTPDISVPRWELEVAVGIVLVIQRSQAKYHCRGYTCMGLRDE